MKQLNRTIALSLVLIFAFSLAGCGASSFASQLRLVLAASGPLINSLNLGPKRGAVIADFTELAGGAATLAEDLKACNKAKPCQLNAVEQFNGVFERVTNRGNFGLSPKLQTIQGILRGIIAAAKIYYGAPSSMAGPPPTEASIKAQIEALKAEMKVE